MGEVTGKRSIKKEDESIKKVKESKKSQSIKKEGKVSRTYDGTIGGGIPRPPGAGGAPR